MNIPSRSAFIAATMLLTVLAIAPQDAWAQTPAQMEYERQQREYWRQQEQQRQEQQRQQQLMNENARRQQEESNRAARAYAPGSPMGQSPTPGYQGATPQMAPRQPGARTDATAATAAAKWVEIGRSPTSGGSEIYADPVTIHRSGNMARMWDMKDYKTTQVVGGTRFSSSKMQNEYDCKGARLRNLIVTAFSGRMGKGDVVRSAGGTTAWESVAPGSTKEALLKFACGKK